MERVDIKLEDLNQESSISYLNSEGRKYIFIGDEMAKIYTNLNDDILETGLNRYRVQRKVELLQNLRDIDELVIPTREVYLNDKFVGFTRPYCDSINLMEYEVKDNNEYLGYLKKISNLLKRLHERNILLGGVNFSNVLVSNNNLKLVNLEGVGIGIFEPDYYAARTYDFTGNNTLSNGIAFKKEFDKLSLFVEFMCYHFLASEFSEDWISGIRKPDYENFKKNINSDFKKYLDLARNYFKLRNLSRRKNLPYLGDVIKDDELEPNRTRRFVIRREAMRNSIENVSIYE